MYRNEKVLTTSDLPLPPFSFQDGDGRKEQVRNSRKHRRSEGADDKRGLHQASAEGRK